MVFEMAIFFKVVDYNHSHVMPNFVKTVVCESYADKNSWMIEHSEAQSKWSIFSGDIMKCVSVKATVCILIQVALGIISPGPNN